MHPTRLHSRISKALNQANRDFGLIGEGDRILVALSGGKDSYGLLWALQRLQAAASFKFDLVCYHLDQGQPGHDPSPLEAHMQRAGLPYEIEYQDTYTRVVEKTQPGKIFCSLCSRFRRAILYKAAVRHTCNKVALGHHRDDLIETLLLNIFFSGQIKAMPARLVSDKGHLEVIRPLCYVPEEELVELAEQQEFVIMPCQLCGSQEAQRKYIKNLLQQLSAHSPHVKGNLLAALGNVLPTHLLDRALNPLFTGDVNAALELGSQALPAPLAKNPARKGCADSAQASIS
jgi:tRNA 2-thiocytidine biosynthesis protein TtcA